MPGPAQLLDSQGDGYPWRDLPTSADRLGKVDVRAQAF